MNKREFGKVGETLAAEYLLQQGFVILMRNYWCSAGEIDIVAQKGDFVHFVEVKTRGNEVYGSPSESITRRKIVRMRRTAETYMKNFRGMPGLAKNIQLDLIEISIRHLEDIREVPHA